MPDDFSMRIISTRNLIVFAAVLVSFALAIAGLKQLYSRGSGYGLPYHAQFSPELEDRWSALGGTWEIADGSIRSESNDRGPKLITGSQHWKNYVVEADMKLLGKGSMGILARVNGADIGEDSFQGYFAAVRAVDNSLILGAYDFAYHEAAKALITEPVRPFRWYHVTLKVEGCRISASARSDGMPTIETAALNDPDCFRSGRIGLRSNGTGAEWRNITVLPIDSAGKVAKRDSAADTRLPTGPAAQLLLPLENRPTNVPAQSIASLLYFSPLGSPPVSIRGSVVLTRPSLYVEDSTGGVEVQLNSAMPLKIGDEVEVTGKVSLDQYSQVIRKANVRLSREAVPLSPIVLTSTQAASGTYDGRFVQVEGRLRSMSPGKNGSVTIDLDAGTQSFHAILPVGRTLSHAKNLAVESRLRLRGVAVAGPKFNITGDPFVILVRSAEDLELLAGPPFWRPSTVISAVLAGFGLIFTFNHLYLRAKQWRLRAVADERERLAHEIHDTLAQSFAGIGFQLQAIRNSVRAEEGALASQVDLAMQMARTSHEEARRSIASLRPESLGARGLLHALRECAERMVQNGNVTVETFGEDGGRAVPARIKDTLYRIGQEAIANAIRHADPRTIRIRLQRTRRTVCLSIEDDGEGFVANSGRAGFGLLGMRKRAEDISATLMVKSKPGSGTRVEVKAEV